MNINSWPYRIKASIRGSIRLLHDNVYIKRVAAWTTYKELLKRF